MMFEDSGLTHSIHRTILTFYAEPISRQTPIFISSIYFSNIALSLHFIQKLLTETECIEP